MIEWKTVNIWINIRPNVVDDDGDAQAVLNSENVLKKGGFAGTL